MRHLCLKIQFRVEQYVRQEFQAHRDVKEEQQRQFMKQWQDYEAHLTVEAVSARPRVQLY